MTPAAWMLLAWVLSGAAFLVLHLVALWRALRARELAVPWRLLALVPPATPVVAWMGRERTVAVLWGLALAIYVVLRIVGS
jgi:hypothetical protein